MTEFQVCMATIVAPRRERVSGLKSRSYMALSIYDALI